MTCRRHAAVIRVLASLVCLTIGPVCLGQDAAPGPARSQLNSFSADLQSLQARFEQTVTDTDGRVESTGSGELWLARPRYFRWDYQGEFPELIVADGARVWMYDEALEQVTVKPQSKLVEDSPLTLLTNLSVLDDRFRVRELGRREDLQLLELSPRDSEAEFERILLGLSDSRLCLMVLEDGFGMRTELRFSEIVRNSPLPDQLFRFQPPPEADIVGEPGEVP